jgi:ATP-dependent Zn protease
MKQRQRDVTKGGKIAGKRDKVTTENAVAKQERIAFHEAGHAVIHQYFSHPLESVAISESDGHCKTVAQWEEKLSDARINYLASREHRIERIMVGCAGKAVMDRLYGYKVKDDTVWRASTDYKQAFKYALQLNDDDSLGAELVMTWLERKTDLLIEKEWPRVHKLAFALLEKHEGELTGDQIRKILGE